MLACKRVTKKRSGRAILTDVSFAVEPGDCVCIAGPAGSGKTLLFDLLTKAEEPTSGTVEIDGVPLGQLPPPILQLYRSRLGIIFQEPHLFDHLTVHENVTVPLEILGMPEALMQKRTDTLLDRLGLGTKADMLPRALARSEQMLAGIARAFIASPLIILADEPLQLLDAAGKEKVTALLREARERGASVIVFTSDLAIADALEARILILEKGKLTEQGIGNSQPSSHHRILEDDAGSTPTASGKGARKIRVTAIHT